MTVLDCARTDIKESYDLERKKIFFEEIYMNFCANHLFLCKIPHFLIILCAQIFWLPLAITLFFWLRKAISDGEVACRGQPLA